MFNNQSDYERTQAVRQIVIEPMARLYHAPAHLRTDKQAYTETLREYERALEGFSKKALSDGWDATKDEHKTWNWPHPQVIRDNCRKQEKFSAPRERVDGTKWPWEDRAERIRKLTDEYTANYSRSCPLASEAKDGGWFSELISYVQCVASVQAQIICGQTGIGYDARIIFGRAYKITPKELADFISEQRQSISDGRVGVSIPDERMMAWKLAAKQLEQVSA